MVFYCVQVRRGSEDEWEDDSGVSDDENGDAAVSLTLAGPSKIINQMVTIVSMMTVVQIGHIILESSLLIHFRLVQV